MKRLFALCLAAASLASCSDTPEIGPRPPYRPVLPAETAIGANTMGAIVNDSIWEAAYQPGQGLVSASPNARYQRKRLSVFGLRRNEVNSPAAYFNLELYNVTTPGTYSLGEQFGPVGQARYAIVGTLIKDVDYVTDATSMGTITITRLDTTRRIRYVSGRFELRAYKRVASTASPASVTAAAALPNELRVVSGRFDVVCDRP